IVLDVVAIGGIPLLVHPSRVPVALFRHALRRPVGPDPELRVPEPFRAPVLPQRLPGRLVRPRGDREPRVPPVPLRPGAHAAAQRHRAGRRAHRPHELTPRVTHRLSCAPSPRELLKYSTRADTVGAGPRCEGDPEFRAGPHWLLGLTTDGFLSTVLPSLI